MLSSLFRRALIECGLCIGVIGVLFSALPLLIGGSIPKVPPFYLLLGGQAALLFDVLSSIDDDDRHLRAVLRALAYAMLAMLVLAGLQFL